MCVVWRSRCTYKRFRCTLSKPRPTNDVGVVLGHNHYSTNPSVIASERLAVTHRPKHLLTRACHRDWQIGRSAMKTPYKLVLFGPVIQPIVNYQSQAYSVSQHASGCGKIRRKVVQEVFTQHRNEQPRACLSLNRC